MRDFKHTSTKQLASGHLIKVCFNQTHTFSDRTAMWLLILFLPLVSQLVAGYSIIEYPPNQSSCDHCKPNEELREVLPCCEPTCDNDCSKVHCEGTPIFVQSCACQSGFVRHEGECICPSQCPTTEQPLCSCPPNEELQPTPPCCEPTCGRNCTEDCRTELVNQPTCVCIPGYVRHEGYCIKAEQCPTCGPYARYSNCTPCCQSTCTMDCSRVLCIAGCTGPPTCLCQTGYVKHNEECIKRELCPKDATTGELLSDDYSRGDVPFGRFPGMEYK